MARAHGTQGTCHLSKLNRAAIGHVFGERVEGIGQLGVVHRLIGQAIGVRDERLRDGFAAIVRRRERIVYRGRHAVEARYARINRAGERIGRGIHGIGDRRGRRPSHRPPGQRLLLLNPFAEDRRLAELVMRSCDDVSTVEYVRSTEEALAIWVESDPTWLANSPIRPSTSALSA